jgi:hypothetical protein
MDFAGLLGALERQKVEFILVGGFAAVAHGAARLTQDVDVVYELEAIQDQQRDLTRRTP